MGTFSKDVILTTDSTLISIIAGEIEKEFINEGYEVQVESLQTGTFDISITKGGMFKAVLGMRTALKVCLIPVMSGIQLKADVGIWGLQAVPFAISMLLFWPVLITQIWGLISQAKLDDKVLAIANRTISANRSVSGSKNDSPRTGRFCPACGLKITDPNAGFCSSCGSKL